MKDLAELEVQDFARLVGTAIEVVTSDGSINLTITAAETTGAPARPDRSFSVRFTGPLDGFLQQDTYEMSHPDLGRPSIFLVPLAETTEHIEYEAVFTRMNS